MATIQTNKELSIKENNVLFLELLDDECEEVGNIRLVIDRRYDVAVITDMIVYEKRQGWATLMLKKTIKYLIENYDIRNLLSNSRSSEDICFFYESILGCEVNCDDTTIVYSYDFEDGEFIRNYEFENNLA